VSAPQPVRVRMGEVVAARDADAPGGLAICGLGSCVAVFLYEARRLKVGGMAHVLLPEPLPGSPLTAPGKFAPTAVAALADRLIQLGAARGALRAKLVGGARMFAFGPRESLGDRNVAAALEALHREGIPVAGMDTGGTAGRTLLARIGTGEVRVTSLRGEPRLL